MDTSEQYINMCRKAKELQETWEPKEGDWIFIQRAGDSRGYEKAIGGFNLNSGYYFYGGGDSVAIRAATDDVVWLPRMDQLISNWTNPYDAIESMLHGWPVEYDETESLEINGIKRVMKLKYNKSWNGEDWI